MPPTAKRESSIILPVPESLVALLLLLPPPMAMNHQSKSRTGSLTLRAFACTRNQQQLKIWFQFGNTLVDPRSSDCEPLIPNQSEFSQPWSR